jgi:photosystem II stability/assembly factor-like uncharacterized protein
MFKQFLIVNLLLTLLTQHLSAQKTKITFAQAGTVYFIEQQNDTLIAGSDIGFLFSADTGNSWAAIENGLPNQAITSYSKDTASGYYLGTFGSGVYKSDNLNGPWIQQSNGLDQLKILSLHNNDSILYAGTYNGGLYQSINNGNNWSMTNLSTEYNKAYVRSINQKDSFLYVGIDYKAVLTYSYNANFWTNITAGLPLPVENIIYYQLPVIDNLLYACTSSGLFYRNVDSLRWKERGLKNYFVHSLCKTDTVLFAGSNRGLHYSKDNGSTWNYYSDTSITSSLNDIYFTDNVIIMGTSDGKILKHDYVGFNNTNDIPAFQDKQSLTVEIFPNPCSELLNICIKKTPKSQLFLEIYNSMGILVKNFEYNNILPNQQDFTISTNDLPAGFYTLKISTGNKTGAKTVVIE